MNSTGETSKMVASLSSSGFEVFFAGSCDFWAKRELKLETTLVRIKIKITHAILINRHKH